MDENRKRSSSILNPQSSIIIPRWGWAYLLMVLGLLAIGLHRSINLLTLLAYALLMLFVLNLLAAKRSLRGVGVRRRLAEWLHARTPCSVEVQVSNTGRRPRWGLRLEDRGPDHVAAWFADWLPGRGSQSFRQNVILPRRGRYSWGEVTLRSGYPFGLVERRAVLVPGEEVIVLPRVGWLHRGRFLRHLRSLSAQPPRVKVRNRPHAHPAAQAEFHGLRAYRSGDSPRLIHWRTSARQGELMVREFEDEPSDNLLLVLDPALPAEWEGDADALRGQFEEAVSLAATICWEWCRRRGDRLGLALAGPNPQVLEGLTGPAHARQVLEHLALAEYGTTEIHPALLARLQAALLPPAVVVLVALGRSAMTNALARTLRRPVTALDATRTDGFDFYSPPA